jgi:CBS domain-containing protein
MDNVGEILKRKEGHVWSVGPRDTVLDALVMLEKRDIGAVVVEDAFGRAVGIVSERDCARKVTLQGKMADKMAVEEIMTPVADMYGVRPDTTVEECILLITDRKIRHLPVFSGKRVVGLISIGDVLKSTIEEKEKQIEHLSNYIAGKYV